jgi:2-polyprenyl-3-methyl-5-hydroxy-6-metoxy-1,4-benzoquinol methylase
MIQSKQELEDWYSGSDPWGYFDNPQDTMRKARILSAIPQLDYENVLDIGCGNGFLTNSLPGKRIIGLEISEKAVQWANKHAAPNAHYLCGSLFDLPDLNLLPMDLIVITGVLYPQYIAESIRLVYVLIDQLLKPGGILVCSHIYAWHKARFPYLTVSREYFAYREYSQVLEVYCK